MFTSRMRQAVALSAVVVAGFGTLQAATASATPAPVRLTVVGSNTTQEVMAAVIKTFNASSVATSENAEATNIEAVPPSPEVAPSDSHCNGGHSITYISGANPGKNQRTAPNGSGDGKTALSTSVTDGDSCTSVARSSSPGSSSDPAGTQAYAYAVDGVTWTSGPDTAAPANLSMTQLEGVYDCKYTNWDQVGGSNAHIDRYYPQEGSGSGSFFAGVLGFDPRTLGGINTCSTPATQIEENEATQIAKDKVNDAVMIFSGGSWIAQANGVDQDLRNGFGIKQINGKEKIVLETNGKYTPNTNVVQSNVEPANYEPNSDTAVQGIRDLFNFINTNSVDYTDAASLAGSASALCTGGDEATVTHFGFHPLAKCIEQF